MLSTIVKISNVTNLSDARYCAGMGVEMLGFTLDSENPQYITPEKFGEIRSWIAGVQLVGETRSEDVQEILRLLEQYPLDALEIGVPAMVPFLISELSIPVLLRINIDEINPEDLRPLVRDYNSSVSYTLLESPQNMPLSTKWEEVIGQLPESANILLGFGLDDIEQIHYYLDTLPIEGISLRGSEELRPGYKDYGMLMDILEALETD